MTSGEADRKADGNSRVGRVGSVMPLPDFSRRWSCQTLQVQGSPPGGPIMQAQSGRKAAIPSRV